MTWDDLLVIIGAIILVLSWLPQAMRIIKNKSSRDVSLYFLIIIMTGTILLIPHSYIIGDIYFTFMNISAAIAQACVIFLALHYSTQDNE